ncbi:amidase family protein [Cohaesibacter celericrescens]|uniref:Amidase n=1 Tax=Cohaesibacter celericrescens TaxID=2067669 RepID=A0A2N5XRG9_9HYPH|nr:amidase family protein [Cohaesibacter celericrescens]PLW77037.1 amidase [Cohaesibacter celericrescens]
MSDQFQWSSKSATSRLSAVKQRVLEDPPELRNIFTQTFFTEAFEQAKKAEAMPDSALAGALISIKDLFDVKGHVTKAGTRFMATDPLAKSDATAIAKLRQAGAVFLGHTNMTELAYSGLGLNPHYGTPENALVDGAIPGGSTSGGAVSVARGLADIAIGTDTGGSLRIPAAFNGIVGFKPSQSTVSVAGCKPLSRSLDSIGPMANSVSACAAAYKTMATGNQSNGNDVTREFVVPLNYGLDDLEPKVAEGFEAAVKLIQNSGYTVIETDLDVLEALKSLPIWQFSSIESRAEYDEAYQNQRDLMDPRVAGPTRMGRANEVNAVEYRKTLNRRAALIEQYKSELGARVLLMPTVPILPPSFDSMESDEEYGRVNLQVLRNPSIANVMDCCSISIPFHHGGSAIGIMLTAVAGHDLSLLNFAEEVHGHLTGSGTNDKG